MLFRWVRSVFTASEPATCGVFLSVEELKRCSVEKKLGRSSKEEVLRPLRVVMSSLTTSV